MNIAELSGRGCMVLGSMVFLVLLLVSVHGESGSVLDLYISEGLQHNLARRQVSFSYEKSKSALDEAKGAFYPSVEIQARYSRAGGGRTIEFPIGDLLNPVYGTLNQMLADQGQEPRFPENLENEEIAFLRAEEQETKVQLVQPLFQAALFHNMKIKKELQAIERAGLELYTRRLIREIKTSYFNYLKAEGVVDLLARTRVVLEENRRVSEKLFLNQKVTKDVVFRAETELSFLEQQQSEAEKNRNISRAYFNFLLDRPFDDPIERIKSEELVFDHRIVSNAVLSSAIRSREEIIQLTLGVSVADQLVKLKAGSFFPSLTGIVDYGFEGEMYRFSEDDDFWMASLVLRWNLFRGFQDSARRQQARCDVSRTNLQLFELKKQVALQVKEVLLGLDVARKTIGSSADRLRSSRQSFEIVSRKYEVGISPQIEFLDARATFTNAEINHIIARYDYQIRYSELEHVSALIDLDQYPVLTGNRVFSSVHDTGSTGGTEEVSLAGEPVERGIEKTLDTFSPEADRE